MITIRQATIDDLPQLAKLFDGYRVFYRRDSDVQAGKDFLETRLNKKDSVIYIAEKDNTLLGFTQLYPTFSSTRMQRSWILNDLYVDKSARGLGVSKLLIDRSKQLCKETNACVLMLETEKDNEIANKLYRTSEFLPETTNFYFWENKS